MREINEDDSDNEDDVVNVHVGGDDSHDGKKYGENNIGDGDGDAKGNNVGNTNCDDYKHLIMTLNLMIDMKMAMR